MLLTPTRHRWVLRLRHAGSAGLNVAWYYSSPSKHLLPYSLTTDLLDADWIELLKRGEGLASSSIYQMAVLTSLGADHADQIWLQERTLWRESAALRSAPVRGHLQLVHDAGAAPRRWRAQRQLQSSSKRLRGLQALQSG